MTRAEILKKYKKNTSETGAALQMSSRTRSDILKKYGKKSETQQLSPPEATKAVIGAVPHTSAALSTDTARMEKMWQKHPEQYAAAKEHAEKMQTDKQYASEYTNAKAEYDAWWDKITTDVSALEKQRAQIEASQPSAWDKQTISQQQSREAAKKQIDELDAKIADVKTAQYAYKYSLIPNRSDYEQYAYDESKKGTELYDSVFLSIASPETLNPSHRAEYNAIAEKYGKDSEQAEKYLLTQLGTTQTAVLSNMPYMTENEFGTFRYILNKEGENAAKEYLGFIQGDINARAAIDEVKKKQAHPIWHSFVAGVDSALPDITSLRNPVTGARPVTSREYTQSILRENTGGLKGFAMDAAGAIGGMVPSIALSAINPYAGSTALAVSVFDQNTQSALREGKSMEDAVTYGVTSAILEFASERVLGGIDGISGQRLSKWATGKLDDVLVGTKKGIATLTRMGVGTAANMASEGFEEWLTSYLDPVIRNALFSEGNETPLISSENLYEGAVGAVTALFLGGSTNLGTANYQETISRLVHNTQGFTDPEVVQMREDFANRIHDAENPVTQTEMNTFLEKCCSEVIAKMQNDSNMHTKEGVQTDAAGTQASKSQAQTVRDSLSRSAQLLLDDVLMIDEIENKDAAANAFEMYYLSGYLGKEFEADTDAEAAFSTEIQRAAFDKGLQARQALGTVTVERGTKVSDEFVTFAGRVAQELHTHISIGGKAPVENGVQTRGYSTKYGELHIYEDAQVEMADGTTLYGEAAARVIVLGHELTHRLQQLAPTEYAAFAELAFRARAGDIGVKAYRHTAGYSRSLAKSELAADYAMERLFTDEKTIGQITKQHSKLAEVIRGILQWIKEKIGKSSAVDRAIYLWNKAYNQASRNAKNADVHDAVAKENTAEGGAKWSLSKTKIEHLKDIIYSLGKKGILLNAGDKRIKVLTDIYTVNKNIHSKKGRSDKEVNARIKAISEFESILKKSKYAWTDTDMRDMEKDAKKGVKAMVHFSAEYGEYALDILFRDKGKTQYLYEVKFMHKKSSQQSWNAKADPSAPNGDVENAINIPQKQEIVKGNGSQKSTSATDELGAALEEIAKQEKYEALGVARKLVMREEGARADGRRYTMSLGTFEQVAWEYAADIEDEEVRKKFVKKLFDAAVNITAAHRSHGDAKAAYYDAAWRGMKSAARVLEKDEELVGDLAEEMMIGMIETGYFGRASTQTERDVLMSTRQAAMDAALFKGKKVSLSEVVLRRENFKKDERIAELLKDNRELRKKADEIRVRGEVQKEWREKYADFKKKYHENDTVQKQRNRIEKNMTALYNWSLKPDKQGHSIPEGARRAILQMLSRIDMHKGEGATLHNIKWGERMAEIAEALYSRVELKKAIEENGIKNVTDGFIPVAAIARLHELAEEIGESSVYEMRGEELQALDEALCILKKNIIDANNIRIEGRKLELKSVAEAERVRLKDLSKSKTKRLTYNFMDSFSYAETVGGLFGDLVKELRSCFDTFIRGTERVRAFTAETVEDAKVQEWRKKAHKVTLGGQEIYMTEAQLMSLYLHNKREQSRGHIYGNYNERTGERHGGGVQPDHRALKKSDAKEWAKGTKEQSYSKVTEAEVQEAIKLLSPKQIEVADKLQRFMADVLGGMGNEVSVRMYGYRAFGEKDYFTIRTVDGANEENAGTDNIDNLFSIMNSGMTKHLTRGANNPILIEDLFDVFTGHASEMLNDYACAEAITNSMRVYNYMPTQDIYTEDGELLGTKKMDTKTLGGRLEESFPGAKAYFKDQIRALNSQKAFGITEFDSILRKMSGNAKAAMVGLNLRVVVQQPTSILRAMAIMDPKYFTPGKTMKKVSLDKVRRYCPIAQWKSWGFYDTEIGNSLDGVLFGERTKYEALKDKQMWLAGKADEGTWSMLWNACEAEIKDKRKDLQVGSEEFYRAVGARLSEVIDATQVVDSPFHRVQAMRSKEDFAKTALSFQSESMKNLNLLYRSVKQGKKPAFRAFLAIEAAGIAAAVGAGILDALRDDDEEKNLWEKYLTNTAENIVGNVNPLSWVPFAADTANAGGKILFAAVDKMLGTNLADCMPRVFDQSRYDTMLLTEFVDLAETLASDSSGWYENVYALLKFADMGTGIGTANAFRDIIGSIMNIANGVSPKGAYKKTMALGNAEKAAANYNAFRDAKCEELAESKYGIEFFKLSGAERKKIRASAESSIRTTTKSLFEESYIKAWKKGDDEAIMRIRATLLATDVYDMDDIKKFFASFVKSYYKDLYKDAKSAGDKEAVIKEAVKAKGRLIGDFRIFDSYAEAKKYFTS